MYIYKLQLTSFCYKIDQFGICIFERIAIVIKLHALLLLSVCFYFCRSKLNKNSIASSYDLFFINCRLKDSKCKINISYSILEILQGKKDSITRNTTFLFLNTMILTTILSRVLKISVLPMPICKLGAQRG